MASVARRGSGIALAVAFAAVVSSFVATSFVVQHTSARVNALASEITDNAAPSIERLELMRRSVLESEIALSQFVHEPDVRDRIAPVLDDELNRLRVRTRAYLNIPAVHRGEQALQVEVHEGWLRFDDAVRHARDLAVSGANAEAEQSFSGTVEPARQHLLEDVTRTVEVNAAHGRDTAVQIRDIRRATNLLSQTLNGICAALALVAAWLLHRQLRRQRVFAETHLKFVEERAAEMERFSGRVAHDIRNPLQAARLAADLAVRKSSEEPVRELSQRVLRGLSRADAITSGLLDFARAGSKPDPGARTDASEVIADVVASMAPEAAKLQIDLQCERASPVSVACSEGVYLSLVGNLVRNAMKYMGDVADRRIMVRISRSDGFVRTEVEDTGPGIAAASQTSLFEPYFRVRGSRAEGLGLGLATVKKLAESHGGRVGLRSAPGSGSTFWFDLPAAGLPADGEPASGVPADHVTMHG